jgi:predicted PurR-regulated permease PerM
MRSVEKLGLALLLIALAATLYVGLPLAEALAFGVALAYITRPAAHSARKVIGPYWSSLLSLVLVMFLLLFFLLFSSTLIVNEAIKLNEKIDYDAINSWTGEFLAEHPEIQEYSTQALSLLEKQLSREMVSEKSTEFMGFVFYGVMGLVNFIVTFLLSVIVAFYLLKDGAVLKERLFSLFPKREKEFVSTAFERIDKDLEAMFVGSLLTALVVWILTSLLLIALEVPYSMLIALGAGLLQLLPMVGPQLLLVPLAVILFFLGENTSAGVIIVFSLVLFFFSDVTVRSLMSKKTKTVHPLVVLVSFIGGVLALGVKGFVIGPIIFASLDGLIKAYSELER